MRIKVEVYETDNGKIPFYVWLKSIKNLENRYIIQTKIERVGLGNLGNTRCVGDNVFELKINHGPGYRLYYAWIGKKMIILLFGGKKNSQSRDIQKAKKFYQQYKLNQKV